MPSPLTFAGRIALTVGLFAAALGACGRRGPLEAPPDPTVQAAAPRGVRGAPATQVTLQGQGANPAADTDDEEEAPSVVTSPVPTPPTRARRRGYVVPKEPFILDPLL